MTEGGGCNESMDGRQEKGCLYKRKSRPDVVENFSSTYPKS